MIDNYLDDVEQIRAEGGLVVIKWDGQRTQLPCTVIVSRQDTDYVWRKDCDDIGSALREAISAYKIAHPA